MAMLPTGAPLAPTAADMSEVHNVGEIWAQTLFQAYINLLAIGPMQTPTRTFAESKRRMADYLVQGMKNTPPEPTFVEQRDAILRPIYTAGKTDPGRMADFLALAKGFADRGLGAGAIAPPSGSDTLNEAIEDTSIKGSLSLESFAIDDSVKSCDKDGVLDAGESGLVTVKVMNGGWETLTGSTITLSSTDTNLTFDNGGAATIASVEPYGTATVTVGVTAKATTAQRTLAALKITMANPNAARATSDVQASALVNYDDKAGVSASDDVESNSTPAAWTPTAGPIPVPVRAWSREGDTKNHFLHGNDTGAPSDETMVSPSLVVSSTTPFVMNFSHRYSFEADVASGIYFDGGIIEISEDNGTTWKDVASYPGIDPGYTQLLNTTAPPPDPDAGPTDAASADANPLAGRAAFAGESPGYPNSWITTSLDFGSTLFAGKTIKVRFRIGTDEGAGAPGWDIDNISFGGPQFSSLTNTPFGAISPNSGTCGDGGTDAGVIDAGRPDATPDVRSDTGTTTDANRGDVASDATTDGTVSDAPKADATTAADAPRDMGTTTTTTTTTGGGTPPDDGCDCSVPGRRSSGNAATMLGILGTLSMVLRRRRRLMH
jgi:hypothetical protein